jgi:hypothetical protein
LAYRIEVLVLAAATAAEVRAGRFDALRRGLENPQRAGVDDSFGCADLFHFHPLSGKYARHQDRPPSVMTQGIATVNQLEWREFE